MEWRIPDRPRRLVTYGKIAQNRTARTQRAQQTSQAQKEQDNNGSITRQPKLGSPIRTEKSHIHSFRDSIEENTSEERSLPSHGSDAPGRNNRSPKRRKLSPIEDDQDSRVVSPRHRTQRSATMQTTYSRKDPLRRSISDISNTSPIQRRTKARISLSPDFSSSNAPVPNNSSIASTQTDSVLYTGGTPSRRRLIDSLGALDDRVDSLYKEFDTSQHISEATQSKEPTPIPSNTRDAQIHYDRTESTQRQTTHEIVESVTSPQSGSPKVTYARQRSFLRSIDIQGDSGGDTTTDLSASLFSVPLQPPPIDHTEMDQSENSGTISSIHELRRAGVNARFRGLVDSIFEDIEDRSSSVSVRRSGFIQLCEKLLDMKFARQFVEIGAFERLTECMSTRNDLIADVLSVYACALVLQLSHLPTTVYMSAWSKFIILASAILPLDDGIPRLVSQRRYSLSKINQAAIRDISLQFGRLLSLDEQESLRLSPRRLLLRSLYSTLRKVREKDIAETIPIEVVSQLVDILLELEQQAGDHDIAPENFILFESTISILETYTTASDITGKTSQDALKPLTKSSYMLLSLSKQSKSQAIQLLTLHLKLILNITNASSSLCENFATAELIHGLTVIVLSNYHTASDNFIDEKRDSLDIVILALGALINLTEVSETARQNILNQKEGSQSLLEELISIFMKGLDSVSEADSVVQTHSNVAFGYLSILLCTLCLEQEVYSVVKGAMNGTGLDRLLATVEEFLHYHRKVDEELHQSQSVKEFTLRLQGILNQVRAIGT